MLNVEFVDMATKNTRRGAAPAAQRLAEAARVVAVAAADERLHENLERVGAVTTRSLLKGGKLLICGNGGSAAETTHFAGELVGPFFDRKRPALAAIPLGCDPSTITAVANDIGYETVFSRQIQALARKGDVLWAMTTSGRSPNIIEALKMARKTGVTSVLFCNHDGGPSRRLADHVLLTPKAQVTRVQELHLMYGHWLCEVIEDRLTRKRNKKHRAR
jgi:D-sedoheptulose 7-phosphate isomerase